MKRMLIALFAVAAAFAGVLVLIQSAGAQPLESDSGPPDGFTCNESNAGVLLQHIVWQEDAVKDPDTQASSGVWVIRAFRCKDQGPSNQLAWESDGVYPFQVFQPRTKPVQTDPLAPVTPQGDLAANTALQQLIGPLSAASDICAAVNALDYADTDDVFRVGATWHYVPAADHDLLPPASRMSAIWGSVAQCAAPAPPTEGEGGGQDPPSDEGAGADG